MSILYAYYGDDFTGSTDALEALAMNGIRTVLFTGTPDAGRLAAFSDYDAVGLAGESRSRSPEWMRERLPDALRFLHSLSAEVTQYKVCSTFDSSPDVGNIAVAMKVGRDVFGSAWTPVVVAAPHLRRYVLFGNLFAGQGEYVHRIDRHPTMSRHPITPMRESDLRLHLRAQGAEDVENINVLSLLGANAGRVLDHALARGNRVIIFDGLDERTELETGRLLWHRRADYRFAAGSSGLTHAFVRHWREAGVIEAGFSPDPAAPSEALAVISGSCSPVTEEQICFAMANGFEGFQVAGMSRDELVEASLSALSRRKSIIIYSAPGSVQLTGEPLGRYLGDILRQIVTHSGVTRCVIAGGDTSSYAVQEMGIHALTFAAPMVPGAPLCRAHSDDASIDRIEMVLKGGQVGKPELFIQVLKGSR